MTTHCLCPLPVADEVVRAVTGKGSLSALRSEPTPGADHRLAHTPVGQGPRPSSGGRAAFPALSTEGEHTQGIAHARPLARPLPPHARVPAPALGLGSVRPHKRTGLQEAAAHGGGRAAVFHSREAHGILVSFYPPPQKCVLARPAPRVSSCLGRGGLAWEMRGARGEAEEGAGRLGRGRAKGQGRTPALRSSSLNRDHSTAGPGWAVRTGTGRRSCILAGRLEQAATEHRKEPDAQPPKATGLPRGPRPGPGAAEAQPWSTARSATGARLRTLGGRGCWTAATGVGTAHVPPHSRPHDSSQGRWPGPFLSCDRAQRELLPAAHTAGQGPHGPAPSAPLLGPPGTACRGRASEAGEPGLLCAARLGRCVADLFIATHPRLHAPQRCRPACLPLGLFSPRLYLSPKATGIMARAEIASKTFR